jgi:hypothetical protein
MVPAGIVALLNCFIGQGFMHNSADYVRSSQSVPPLAFSVMNDTAGGQRDAFRGMRRFAIDFCDAGCR